MHPLRRILFDKKPVKSKVKPQAPEAGQHVPPLPKKGKPEVAPELRPSPVQAPTDTLGFASDLKKVRKGQETEQELRSRLQGEAGVESVRAVNNPRTGQMGVKVEDVAQILHKVSQKRGASLQDALSSAPPEQHDEIRLGWLLKNMKHEMGHQLTQGVEGSGITWYDEGGPALEGSLIDLADHSPAFDKVRGYFGRINPETKDVEAHRDRMDIFKVIFGTLSPGTNPEQNTKAALDVMEGAAANYRGEGSLFANLPTKNPKTGMAFTRYTAGYTNAFKIIGRMVSEMGEAGFANWLKTEHPVKDIRAVNKSFKPNFGTDRPYLGAFAFGPKVGAYFLNTQGEGEHLTADLWHTRNFHRILGSLLDEKGEIRHTPTPAERQLMDVAATDVAKEWGLTKMEVQAGLWYYEQQLWAALGTTVSPKTIKGGAHAGLKQRGIEPTAVREASRADEERRQAAVLRATRQNYARDRGESKISSRTKAALIRLSRLRYAQVAQPAAAGPTPVTSGTPMPQQGMPTGPNMAAPQKSPEDEHREHLLSYSPNQEEGLTFEDALARVRSGNQKAFKQIIKHVTEQVGIKPQLQDAVGDWSDGAENSILQSIKDPIGPDTAEYLAAWYGLLGNQKAVLSFTPAYNGADSVYQIELPQTDMKALRAQLDKSGIPFRTLVPSSKGTKVVIYDQGRELRDKVAQFAGVHNAPIRESVGQGRFIGGDTRTAARAAYRKIITKYESTKTANGGSLPAYRPPVEPHHLRESGPSPEGKVRQARTGSRIRYAKGVDETWDTAELRDRRPAPRPKFEEQPTGPDLRSPAQKLREEAHANPRADLPDVEHDPVESQASAQNEQDLELSQKHGEHIGTMAKKILESGSRGAWLTLHHLGLGGYARELMARHKGRVKMARRGGVKAPAQGVIVRGMFYPGGKFIPSANLEKSKYDQYRHVEEQRARYARGDVSAALTAEALRKEQK